MMDKILIGDPMMDKIHKVMDKIRFGSVEFYLSIDVAVYSEQLLVCLMVGRVFSRQQLVADKQRGTGFSPVPLFLSF